MSSRDKAKVIFTGSSDADCERFIQAVRKLAFLAGIPRDLTYMAAYAATCLKGPARQWFDQLDPETQTDWNKLRVALLQQFPGSSHGDSAPAASIPEAPASSMSQRRSTTLARNLAATSSGLESVSDSEAEDPFQNPSLLGRTFAEEEFPPPELEYRKQTLSPSGVNLLLSSAPERVTHPIDSATRSGRIVVIAGSSRGPKRYIRARLNRAGLFKSTTHIKDSLVVQFRASSEPFNITLQNSRTDYDLLGIAWDANEGQAVPLDLEHWSELGGDLVAVTGSPTVSHTSTGERGKAGAAVWTVDGNGYVEAIWPDVPTAGAPYSLDVMCRGDRLYVAADAVCFRKDSKTNYQEARLLFEPL